MFPDVDCYMREIYCIKDTKSLGREQIRTLSKDDSKKARHVFIYLGYIHYQDGGKFTTLQTDRRIKKRKPFGFELISRIHVHDENTILALIVNHFSIKI